MPRIRTVVLAACTLFVAAPALSVAPLAQSVVAEFAADPLQPKPNAPLFEVVAPGGSPFTWEADSPSRFLGDPRGSVAAVHDSLAPTARLFTALPSVVTQADSFVFGAVLTLRADGFDADPFGFHPIAITLFNAGSTGDDRTGDLSDFRADTFDTLEMAYFPNISPFFGGPFLAPTAFGERIADDAFANFSFSSAPVSLQTGVTYLVLIEHDADAATLTIDLHRVQADGRAVALPASRVVTGLSNLSGFSVDSLGIAAYHDGFNEFATSGRSLHAVVDYDLLIFGVRVDGALPREVEKALKRFQKPSRLTIADPNQP